MPTADLDPDRHVLHRADVRDGLELAYVREGVGGYPLLLVHGWPETARLFWRVIGPLADAGFEVIAPDLRGYGASGLAPDGCYDVAAHARDLQALVADVLGHERCAAAGGDLGSGVVVDLGLRFPGLVERQVIWNGILPILPEAFAAAGLPAELDPRVRQSADYFLRQGRDADALAAELATPEQRRRYVAQMYTSRHWASPGAFTTEAVAFHTEPFGDAAHLRAGFGNYESALGAIPLSEPPMLFSPSPVETVALYGPEDHVIWPDFPQRCAVAFPDLAGPYVVPGAGHFLPWERADLFVRTVTWFLRDRLA